MRQNWINAIGANETNYSEYGNKYFVSVQGYDGNLSMDPPHAIDIRSSVKLDLPEEFKQVGIREDVWESTDPSIKQLIVLLHARIAELEEKLNANSGNSSKPPSSDPPWVNPKKRKKKGKKKRKRGGQPGHEGKTRDLVPPEDVDETIKCSHTECEHCGCEDIEKIAGDFRRHQTFDLPEIKPIVTEFQQARYWCPDCERWHTAMLPLDAGKGMLGPGLEALVALLAGTYHMSHRGIEEFLADAFNMKVSIGTISNTEARVSEALEEPVEELKTHVQSQPVVGADETGWKVAGRKAWMWVTESIKAHAMCQPKPSLLPEIMDVQTPQLALAA